MDITMPQGRIVLKSICQSKKMAELKTDGARLLLTWLIPNVDINGCFSGVPEVIKGQIFTRLRKSTKSISSYLKDLDRVGVIILYQANGDTFLNIPDFADKQPSLNPDREGKPTIPLPTPDQLRTSSRQTPPKVKESKVKLSKEEVKKKYIDFVFLTQEEYNKLTAQFGTSGTVERITALNDYIGAKGTKYKSHYHTILMWSRKDKPSAAVIADHKCSRSFCTEDAVYSGVDDTGLKYYLCEAHKPKGSQNES